MKRTARLRSFHELMQQRVQRILLVSSAYDSFIMSEEGHLHETLLSHFIDLNLGQTPDLVQVTRASEAHELLAADDRFDLVVSSLHAGDSNAAEMADRMRAAGIEVPVMALAYTGRELHEFVEANDTSNLERIFLWQGDVRIFLAMVMYLEDRLNVENDTGERGVPAIIVVEDNPRYYSAFLPAIYTELFRHTHRLLSEDLNISQKMMRMRARPKILLTTTFEEAWETFERYPDQTLGVISDVEYPRAGVSDPRAGIELCSRAAAARPDIRLVLQSSDPDNRALADEIGASFLLKGSPLLLHQLREILVDRFGFGDFVFRMLDRSIVDRASGLRSLFEKLATVPEESIAYHAQRNHFSNWLKARTEFALAERLKPRTLEEFGSVQGLRDNLLKQVQEHRTERNRTLIVDFDSNRFDPEISFTRIGEGSLGGKARGVAFANRVLSATRLQAEFPDVEIHTPPSVVLATEVFEQFLEYEGLRDYTQAERSDDEILSRCLEAPFPRKAARGLRAFLQRVRYPLAIRSSSLLEDSLSQPFAGVYRTTMLPNNDPELDVRFNQLANAIKRVYASAFTQQAKTYLSMTSFRLEEERMGVMLQALAGRVRGDLFYPDFSGVARSNNFYPEPGQKPEDGVAAVALGLGHTVVGGDPCLRFCPRYPQSIIGHSSVKDALQNSQREFYALDLARETREQGLAGTQRYPLGVAEADGPLAWLGSTYSPEDNRIVDGIARPGVRLVSFAQVLKHGVFPLAEILNRLLERCSEGTGGPVEIEFAGNLATADRKAEFAFLQMRPLALTREFAHVELGDLEPEQTLCRSPRVLGNGRVDGIRDLVVVDTESFERQKSHEAAVHVSRFDAQLRNLERPYLLIGVGRWGSADPRLGIPVSWNQIAGARVIVESGFRDMKVAPSQGTHFFQNLTSGNVGYFTVNPDAGEGHLDWDWLTSLPAEESADSVRRIRLPGPIAVLMSGKSGEGAILKPAGFTS